MANHNDISRQSLIMRDDNIELGGDGEAARVTRGARSSATRGISKTVFNKIKNPEEILTIVFLREDVGHRQLIRREAENNARPIRLLDPGRAINGVTGEVITWKDCQCQGEGDFILSEETGTITWTYALTGVTRMIP